MSHNTNTYHNERPLHPSFPFFSLRSTKKLDTSCGFLDIVFPSTSTRNKQDNIHNPKHGRIMIFVAFIRVRPIVPNVCNNQDNQNLALGLAKVLASLPRRAKGRHRQRSSTAIGSQQGNEFHHQGLVGVGFVVFLGRIGTTTRSRNRTVTVCGCW